MDKHMLTEEFSVFSAFNLLAVYGSGALMLSDSCVDIGNCLHVYLTSFLTFFFTFFFPCAFFLFFIYFCTCFLPDLSINFFLNRSVSFPGRRL